MLFMIMTIIVHRFYNSLVITFYKILLLFPYHHLNSLLSYCLFLWYTLTVLPAFHLADFSALFHFFTPDYINFTNDKIIWTVLFSFCFCSLIFINQMPNTN